MNRDTYMKALEASRLYYEKDWNQTEIADKLDLSRARVSRLLKLAKEEGIVQVIIRDLYSDLNNLATQVKDRFELKEVIVEDCTGLDANAVRRLLSRSAADYIKGIIGDEALLGLSWGRTIQELATLLEPKSLNGVSVIPLKGCVGTGERLFLPALTLMQVAKCYNATPYFLPVPLLMETVERKESLLTDESIKHIWMLLDKKVDIAVFSIARLSNDSGIVRAGYITPDEIEKMRRQGAVCDVCSHYFRENGEIFDSNLDERTISVPLSTLRRATHSIGICGDAQIASGIQAAILSGVVNTLVIDKQNAIELMRSE